MAIATCRVYRWVLCLHSCWKSGRELHTGLNKGTIGLECLLGTRRTRREGSSTFSHNSLKRWGLPGIGEDSVCFCQGTAR